MKLRFDPRGALAPRVTSTPDGVQIFDWRHLPATSLPFSEGGKGWARGIRRDPENVDVVLAHQWGTAVGTVPEARTLLGVPLALAARACEAPYHGSCGVARLRDGALIPVVALVHPTERHTMHAGPANGRSLGVGVMGRFPMDETRRDVARHGAFGEAEQAAMRLAFEHLLAEFSLGLLAARAGSPAAFLTHRQSVSSPLVRAQRTSDPGEWIVAAACRAIGEGRVRLTVDPDATVGKYGKPWPEAWRRHLPRQVTLDDVAAAARASEQRLLTDDAASGPFAVTPPAVDGTADPFA